MSWDSASLLAKAKAFTERAHDNPVDSALCGFWMSLSLELLARAALAKVHPVLLADPTQETNVHYAFGKNQKVPPKSIGAKAVFARCSIYVDEFTDQMSTFGLIIANRRNEELHTGDTAFEGLDNSSWLPQIYEIFDVLLQHLAVEPVEFYGQAYAKTAKQILADRRKSIKAEVAKKIGEAKGRVAAVSGEVKADLVAKGQAAVKTALSKHRLRRACICPACGFNAALTGEVVSRSPTKIDEEATTISREARVLPNQMVCGVCKLKLEGYQELLEAKLGNIYTASEEDDPLEYFGIIPEEHVDVEKMVREYHEQEYNNE